jgi:hypothetical protein
MDKTERFRGRLMAGDRVVLPTVEGLLKTHPRNAGGIGEWTGYFHVPDAMDEPLVDGNRYRLVLIDGRSGHVALHVSHDKEIERPLAKFHGTGSFRR